MGKVTSYTNADNLIFDMQEDTYYDLIFLDIEMEPMNGMTAAANIRQIDPGCLLIFLTSYLQYAIDAFQFSAFRFIPKALLNERFETDLAAALKEIRSRSDHYYIHQTHKSLEKIYYDDILYIKKEGKNSVLFLQNQRKVKIRKSLSDLFKELHSNVFIFTDRGCIVNMAHIMKIENDLLSLRNGENLYISKSNMKVVKSKAALFWSEKI